MHRLVDVNSTQASGRLISYAGDRHPAMWSPFQRGAAKLAGGYVPGPPVVIELTFADGTPVHALQAVDEEP
jgi:hypothetical protein